MSYQRMKTVAGTNYSSLDFLVDSLDDLVEILLLFYFGGVKITSLSLTKIKFSTSVITGRA